MSSPFGMNVRRVLLPVAVTLPFVCLVSAVNECRMMGPPGVGAFVEIVDGRPTALAHTNDPFRPLDATGKEDGYSGFLPALDRVSIGRAGNPYAPGANREEYTRILAETMRTIAARPQRPTRIIVSSRDLAPSRSQHASFYTALVGGPRGAALVLSACLLLWFVASRRGNMAFTRPLSPDAREAAGRAKESEER